MDPQYRCSSRDRRDLVRVHATLNGIDHLEVLDRDADTLGLPRQQFLLVHLFDAAPVLGAVNVRIEVPSRAAAVRVVWAIRATEVTTTLVADPASGTMLTPAQRDRFTGLADADRTVVVLVDGTGDFSTYALRLVTSTSDDTPPGDLDRRLAVVDFSFKVECPSDFDCRPEVACPPTLRNEPVIDYLAKDWSSFRRLMLDRLSILVPGWTDRTPADLQVTLVELLAWVGDQLSYHQDAVATEAYLATARRRVSVRRHVRLLDYRMHDGCNARAWVHLDVDVGPRSLPSGTEVHTTGDQPVVFVTMHEMVLVPVHNEVAFHTWGDTECCLPIGATSATLRVDPDAVPEGARLTPGRVLIFEEVLGPSSGLAADADRTHRHAVRLTDARRDVDPLDGRVVVDVAWHEADALPFPLWLSTNVDGQAVRDISVARANVVLADHGRRLSDPDSTGGLIAPADPLVVPPVVPTDETFQPRLREAGVTAATEYVHREAVEVSASSTLIQDPRAALPVVRLHDDEHTWSPRRDLLASDRSAPEFVVELEQDGDAMLRFGDDVLGKRPIPGTMLRATMRTGNGTAGNVGADAIRLAPGVAGVIGVRNPLPAVGGTDPEGTEEVRQYAPHAFRTQERAVTESDYAEVTERHDGVQKAAARFRWTGSWTTVFITIDRRGGLPVRGDALFLAEIRAHVERYRMAGHDLEITDPVFVPLDLALELCVSPGYFRSDVQQSVQRALDRFDHPRGTRGFFHPDRFTFGQPVHLSQLYASVMAVDGVDSVDVRRFQRLGRSAAGEIDAGVLETAPLEIAQLDNDPSRPGNGRLELSLAGGL